MRLLLRGARSSARGRAPLLAASISLAAMLCSATFAHADSYSFSLSGSGITASGSFTTTDNGPEGSQVITSITGVFSDTNNGFSGAISGPASAPIPVPNTALTPPTTFTAPAFTDAGFSYDNLFWPSGESPAVCIDALAFSGGDFDIYGLVFSVAGGYTVDLWSQGVLGGYFIGDSLNGVKLGDSADGYSVDFTANAPEPSSFLLLGTGALTSLGLIRRKLQA